MCCRVFKRSPFFNLTKEPTCEGKGREKCLEGTIYKIVNRLYLN
jgi:hypothetical protein